MKANAKTITNLFILLMVLLATPFAVVQAQKGLSLGIKGGTTGLGAELSTSLSQNLNARLGGTFYNHTFNGSSEEGDVGIDFNADMNLLSIPLLLDYYPAKRGFRVTAGLHYQDLKISGDATPNESYELNDKVFAPEKLGSLSADIKYESKLAPYLGMGFGNAVAPGSRLKLSLDLGAMYTNSPTISMGGSGLIAPTADQAPNFQDGLDEFKFFPVLNLGLNYRIINRSL